MPTVRFFFTLNIRLSSVAFIRDSNLFSHQERTLFQYQLLSTLFSLVYSSEKEFCRSAHPASYLYFFHRAL